MTRKGRKRTTTRTRSGRAAAPRQSITTPEIETRRRNLLGDTDKHSQDWRTDQRLGSVLGQMHCQGLITTRQYEAGKAVAALTLTWRRMADCPQPHARAANLPVAVQMTAEASPLTLEQVLAMGMPEAEAARWTRCNDALGAVREAVRAVPGWQLGLSLLTTVCGDDLMPPRLLGNWPAGWAVFRACLDAAAGVFKIPEQDKVRQSAA